MDWLAGLRQRVANRSKNMPVLVAIGADANRSRRNMRDDTGLVDRCTDIDDEGRTTACGNRTLSCASASTPFWRGTITVCGPTTVARSSKILGSCCRLHADQDKIGGAGRGRGIERRQDGD